MILTTQQQRRHLTLCLVTPTKMLSKDEVKGWLEGLPMSAQDKERVSADALSFGLRLPKKNCRCRDKWADLAAQVLLMQERRESTLEGWKVAKGLNIIVSGVHLRAETLTEAQAEWAVKIGVPEKFISKIKED